MKRPFLEQKPAELLGAFAELGGGFFVQWTRCVPIAGSPLLAIAGQGGPLFIRPPLETCSRALSCFVSRPNLRATQCSARIQRPRLWTATFGKSSRGGCALKHTRPSFVAWPSNSGPATTANPDHFRRCLRQDHLPLVSGGTCVT